MHAKLSNLAISLNDDIFELCRQNHFLKVKVWLENTENDPNQSDEHLFTPMHWAAMHGHADIVEMLVCKGAKIPTANHGGDTPLHVAVQFNQTKVVGKLLERIKINAENSNDYGFYTSSDIVNLQNGHGNTALQGDRIRGSWDC